MIVDEGNAGIPGRGDRAVGELLDEPGAAAEAAVVAVVDVLLPVRQDLEEPLAVGTDPQVPRGVGQDAADPDVLEGIGELIVDLEVAGRVDHIESFVGADVYVSLPFRDAVDDALRHPHRAVHVPEGRLGQAEETESRRGEPEVFLIVEQDIVDRVVEAVDIDGLEVAFAVNVADAGVRGDDQIPVSHEEQVIDT